MRTEELASGRDAEFAEHFSKVVVHGVGTEAELGGDLGIGRANRGQECHPFFLRGELGVSFDGSSGS